jgi:hypothetical protein
LTVLSEGHWPAVITQYLDLVDLVDLVEIYGLLFLIVQQFFCIPNGLIIEDSLWIMVKDCFENPILLGILQQRP